MNIKYYFAEATLSIVNIILLQRPQHWKYRKTANAENVSGKMAQ